MRRKWMTAAAVVAAALAVTIGACSGADGQEDRNYPRNAEEFDAFFQELSNAGRWGADDELGTANLITPDKVREAAGLVRSGITVSLAHSPIEDEAADTPDAAFNHTISPRLTSDTIEFTYHGYSVSHLDALCHMPYKGMQYNNVPVEVSTVEDGCVKNGISNLQQGIVTRGILLDIPRLKGVPWLEPGEAIYTEDILAWEEEAGVTVGPGDVIFIRTGRWARRAAEGPWQLSGNSPGIHASVVRWIRERDVAFVGSDVATDVQPSLVEDVALPVHLLLISSMGTDIFDNLDLEAVAETAAAENRWEFMLTAAPLAIIGGTGSPLNPIAIF